MLSKVSRRLTYLSALLYAILGILLFILPERLAPVFAWSVTAFITMTIGGWSLGNAWLAWAAARRWQWALVYPTLIYLWVFGVGQLIVLYAFRARLVLLHPIAWLYLAVIGANAITALAGVMDWIRLRPGVETTGTEISVQQRVLAGLFILFVGFLGLYGLTAPIGAPATNGGIFPQIMSVFTLRSFGAFYLSIALGVIAFLWEKKRSTFLTHAFASYGLIVFITLAALVYIRLFDFAARPGGLAYFGAYLAVGIYFLNEFRKSGPGVNA